MTSVGKGGAGGPAKGLAPAHFFPLEGTVRAYGPFFIFVFIFVGLGLCP